ncbi:MAG: hypothetical protein RJA21_310, partial [Gemmatimonadota bacterium]
LGTYQFSRPTSGQVLQTDFPGTSVHFGVFHDWRPEHGEPFQHLSHSLLAYFLGQLDSHVEGNGKTLLDNSLIVIGTEYGQNHGKTNVFHAIAGGNGYFKPGFYGDDLHIADVYNAALTPYGAPATIGTLTNVGGAQVSGLYT